MKKIFCFLFFITILATSAIAQISLPNKDQALKELEQRGISEEMFRDRMLERGYDIDNIDPLTVNLSELEREVESVVKELEQEQQASELAEEIEAVQDTLEEATTEIQEAVIEETATLSADRIKQLVDQGIPLEEAIALELNESQQNELPETTIYGQHIFRNKDLAVYNSAVDIRPPDNYILGAGDKISVLIWGASLENASFEINKSGFIQPSGMRRINLKGVSYIKAKELLRRRFAERYRFRPEEFEVTIDNARTLTINIIGEGINTGSFNLPALNTAFNALVAAGGPSDIGSVRNIKLIHSDGKSVRVDVYEFMLDPSKVKDFFLQNNDYIFIPVAENLVKIDGAINRPFTYELIAGEGLKKLIKYAGGLKDNAYQSTVQVKRFVQDQEIIIDVDLRALYKNGGEFPLQKGDQVFIKEIPNSYKNYAAIEGAVELAGEYEITKGMRVSDLIKKGILATDARKDNAFIQRKNPDKSITYLRINIETALQNKASTDNYLLQSEDRLIVLSQSNYVDEQTFSVSGAVRTPGTHPFDPAENLTIEDAIIIAGGTLADATDFAYIHRKDPKNRKLKEYIRVNLKNVLENPTSSDNIKLRPLDSLVIYNYQTYQDDAYIKVEGAVRSQGTYPYDESLSLKDALTLSGGLRLNAAYNRIDISSLFIENNQETRTITKTVEVDKDYNIIGGDNYILKPYDLIYVRQAPEFEFQQVILLKGEIKFPGRYPLVNDNEKVLNLVKRAGGLTQEAFPAGATLYRVRGDVGYVVMALDEVMDDPESRHNFILKDGDIIEIPKQKDFVSIRGATKAKEIYPDKILRTGQVNVPYHAGKNAKWYVDQYAAGVGEDGRKRFITVEHPNGQIKRTRDYGFFKKYPKVEKGSIVTVGQIEKVEQDKKKERKEIDWGKVLADSVAQATAILTLILLIESR